MISIDLFSANLDEKAVEQLPSTLNEGVYYGWGQLVNDDDDDENQRNIYKMVTSIGTNPFYHGEKKTIVRKQRQLRRDFLFFSFL